MIPIGAYHPRDYFSWQHVDPEEAVQVHVDLQSRRSVGMHWGTFFLTFEPVEEPPVRLRSVHHLDSVSVFLLDGHHEGGFLCG